MKPTVHTSYRYTFSVQMALEVACVYKLYDNVTHLLLKVKPTLPYPSSFEHTPSTISLCLRFTHPNSSTIVSQDKTTHRSIIHSLYDEVYHPPCITNNMQHTLACVLQVYVCCMHTLTQHYCSVDVLHAHMCMGCWGVSCQLHTYILYYDTQLLIT